MQRIEETLSHMLTVVGIKCQEDVARRAGLRPRLGGRQTAGAEAENRGDNGGIENRPKKPTPIRPFIITHGGI